MRGLIGLALLLPYERRVGLFGWLTQHLIAPLAGYRIRAIQNLGLIYPDMNSAERRRIANAVANNVGRSLIENYSPDEFKARMANAPLEGPGLTALQEAKNEGRPVILVSGHYGNYEAVRSALAMQGFPVGCLYRPMRNPYFNAHYEKTLEGICGPAFPQGSKGMRGFVKHLKQGGMLGILNDLHQGRGIYLQFMGKPAKTSLSAAEMALKYGALVIPFYGTRQENGLDFRVELEAPIPNTDAETMTQAISDSLERRVRAKPEQWFWIHRRWKGKEKKALTN